MPTVIEVRQDYPLANMALADVPAYFAALGAELRALDPDLALVTPRTLYRALEAGEQDRCPWGYSWFIVAPDGTLQLWRSNWDSSG